MKISSKFIAFLLCSVFWGMFHRVLENTDNFQANTFPSFPPGQQYSGFQVLDMGISNLEFSWTGSI